MTQGFDAQDIPYFESCSSSMACDMEEMSSESSKKVKDMDEMTSEASWTAVTRGNEKDVWSPEPEGEAEKPEATGLGSEVKGVPANPEGESCHRYPQAKNGKEGKRKSNKNGEEGK